MGLVQELLFLLTLISLPVILLVISYFILCFFAKNNASEAQRQSINGESNSFADAIMWADVGNH